MNQPELLSGPAHPLGGQRVTVDLTSHDGAEPIVAGMRARAVADACERLRLAAVLIDAGGRVLHLTSRAKRLMGQDVDVQSEHLVGRTKLRNAALQRALNAALLGPDAAGEPSEATAETLRVCGLPYRDTSPYQLLRGLLVLDAADDDRSLHTLRALLAA